jgi:hypothetical protein
MIPFVVPVGGPFPVGLLTVLAILIVLVVLTVLTVLVILGILDLPLALLIWL